MTAFGSLEHWAPTVSCGSAGWGGGGVPSRKQCSRAAWMRRFRLPVLRSADFDDLLCREFGPWAAANSLCRTLHAARRAPDPQEG